MNRIYVTIVVYCWCLTSLLTGCLSAPRPQLSAYQDSLKEQKIVSLVTEATTALRTGTWESLERAQNALELARDLSPRDPRVYDGLGCVEWRRKHYKLAEHFFDKALEVNPQYDRGYVHLALIAEQNGDAKKAAELLKVAIKLNPLNFRARNNYAALLLQEGSSQAALQQLLRAYESAGDDIVLFYNLNQATKLSRAKSNPPE